MNVSEYNKCVDIFSDNLYRFILKNIRDTEKAKDVVQETFTRLWTKHENVEFSKAKSYVFTSGYHIMIDMIRKDKRSGDFNEVHENMHQTDRQYSDLNEILHEALDKLPEVQKSVILLRDYEGYSYDEISEITGLSESQVKVYIFRGRKFLKKYIVSMELVM